MPNKPQRHGGPGDTHTAAPTSCLSTTAAGNCAGHVELTVRRRWSMSGYPGLTALDCRCIDGVLFIYGSVATFYYKQLAQELVRNTDDIERIINEVVVVEPETAESDNENAG